MKGDPKVIQYLNAGLKGELTAINQYFLHARMLENWGITKLGKHEYNESIDEMKHADALIQRILFLEGLPNLQDLGKLMIGENVKEIFESDMKLELDGIANYREAAAYANSVNDFVTRDLITTILEEEEGHVDYLETQFELIERMGMQNYIQMQTEPNEAGGPTGRSQVSV